MVFSQLVYSSEINLDGFRSDRPVGSQLRSMLDTARESNSQISVTGILLFSAGHFLQVLEGHPLVLKRLYRKIAADPRHKDVKELAFLSSESRIFDTWFMGLLNLDERHDIDPELFEEFKEKARLALDDNAAHRMVIELLRTFKQRLEGPSVTVGAH